MDNKLISKNNIAEKISERAKSISPSGIRKFFDLISGMEGIISLGVGEPDYITPWRFREAAIYSIESGYTSYTSNYGLLELREAIANELSCRYAINYDPQKEILITVGVSEGLDLAARATINPGDEVIIPDPGYVAYAPCVILSGGKIIPVKTKADNCFKVLAKDIENLISSKTKSILLGFPNNPTGAVMPKDELLKISQLAKKNNLLVISDEIYSRLVYETEHICVASLPDMKERTILLGGFSKAYAMTGWRIGYVAAHKDLIEAMLKIHQYTIMCAPIMAQKAALEALLYGESLVLEMLEDYNYRRLLLVKGLNEIGLKCHEPQGAFYVFPDISITGMSSETFAEKLLLEEKVVVVPGKAFGECGENHIRCCYATSITEINEALLRMRNFVEKYSV